jgi:hypothetical protein
VKLYHRTTPKAATSIIAEGFRDGGGYFGTAGDEFGNPYRGVWLCDRPFDAAPLADNTWGVVLELSIPEAEPLEEGGEPLAYWEWVEEGKGYREFLVPSAIVNRYGPPQIVNEDDLAAGSEAQLSPGRPALEGEEIGSV